MCGWRQTLTQRTCCKRSLAGYWLYCPAFDTHLFCYLYNLEDGQVHVIAHRENAVRASM